MTPTSYQYDVALSFAGEDRSYVEEVAQHLKNAGVRVFYDKYEEVELWGKNLYTHLDEIYRRKAHYCIIFISSAYGKKLWTNHERESAQARAFEENEEYILPAKLDDSEIPGVRPTTGYIDLRKKLPHEFAQLIISKVGQKNVNVTPDQPPSTRPTFRRPRLGSRNFNPYDAALKFIERLTGELQQRANALAEEEVSNSLFDREGRKCLRIVMNGQTVYSLDVWIGGMSDSNISFFGRRGENLFSSGSMNAWGRMIWNREVEDEGLQFNDLSLLGHISGEKTFTLTEFVDAVWDVVCNAIEEQT